MLLRLPWKLRFCEIISIKPQVRTSLPHPLPSFYKSGPGRTGWLDIWLFFTVRTLIHYHRVRVYAKIMRIHENFHWEVEKIVFFPST